MAPLAPVLSNLIGKGQAVCPRDSDSDSDSDLERASDSDSGPPSDAWHDTVDSAKKAMRALLLLGAHAPTHAFVYDGGVQVVGACAAHVKVSARAFLLGENLSRLPGLMVVLVWCPPPAPRRSPPRQRLCTPLACRGCGRHGGHPCKLITVPCRVAGKPHHTLDAGGRRVQHAGAIASPQPHVLARYGERCPAWWRCGRHSSV